MSSKGCHRGGLHQPTTPGGAGHGQRRDRKDHRARVPRETIEGAWENLTFTVDPVALRLRKSAADAEAVGLLDPVDLAGIYDLTLLNQV